MTEITLESLAERVAALEQAVGLRTLIRPGKPPLVYRPGTGNWAAAEVAARQLSKTYDFDAINDQDEVDFRHVRE